MEFQSIVNQQIEYSVDNVLASGLIEGEDESEHVGSKVKRWLEALLIACEHMEVLETPDSTKKKKKSRNLVFLSN